MLTQDEARKIIEKALSYAKADACGVSVGQSNQAQTRFARNTVTTGGNHHSVVVSVSAVKGNRTGTTASNGFTDDELRQAVRTAEELASFAPPNPEFVAPLAPQKYPPTASFDAKTAAASQAEMAPGIRAAIEGATAKKLNAAGFFQRETVSLAFGTSTGNAGHAEATLATYTLTARTADGTGSGWASAGGRNIADIDGVAVSRTAIDKAVLSQQPRDLTPGEYTVVLEPAAVAGFISMIFDSFDARDAEEGRSLLTKKGGGTLLGEKLFSEKITARTDPFDARNAGLPWDGNMLTEIPNIGGAFFGVGGGRGMAGDYLPARRMNWIEKGVVKNLSYDRYWAQQKGVEPTPDAGSNLVIEGEDHSVDDLVKSTERGLLITRFWYIRTINPQTVQVTGLTRDGVFMIENGKVAYPVRNFRWNESPARSLQNVDMLSRVERVPGFGGAGQGGIVVVPGMKIRGFPVSSLSEAV